MALGTQNGAVATEKSEKVEKAEKAPVVNGTNMETLPRAGKQVIFILLCLKFTILKIYFGTVPF